MAHRYFQLGLLASLDLKRHEITNHSNFYLLMMMLIRLINGDLIN